MATLNSIAITLAGGAGVFSVTLAMFGCAVVKRSTFVAARCEARPRNVIYNPDPSDKCQARGNTPFGWLKWAMRLTYDTMLSGVPGTGTRQGGLKGALLKVNLDGIVLLRFHHLALRICTLATILYLTIVLPVFYTSECVLLEDGFPSSECISTQSNLTDYQRLTLSSIPKLTPSEENESFVWFDFQEKEMEYFVRMYAVVFCSWIVTFYTLYQLKMEWVDLLAIRRVYYLEADHYGDRAEELERIENDAKDTEEDPLIAKRSVWVPHPEQRDTVPNIELYSLLVGGLPSLPTQAVEDVEAVFSKKQSMDWQLNVTTAFFDHCVPNQPGFSSSVAAVTILPAAEQVSVAWGHWYNAAGKVRRLRFIRRRIADLQQEQLAKKRGSALQDSSSSLGPSWIGPNRYSSVGHIDFHRFSRIHDDEFLGSNTDLEVEDHLFHALNFGPEQTAVYAREFAMGGSNLAPHGWNEGKIERASMEELLKMEEKAAMAVQRANWELEEARDRIAESHDGDLSSIDSSDDGSQDDKGVAPTVTSSEFSMEDRMKRMSKLTDISELPSDFSEREYETELKDNAAPLSVSPRSSIHSIDPLSLSRRSDTSSDEGRGKVGFSFARLQKRITKKNNSSSKARLSTAILSRDLDLEAGLFKEQRKLTKGKSQHLPRMKKIASRLTRSQSPTSRQGKERRGSTDMVKEKKPKSISRRVKSSGDLTELSNSGSQDSLDEAKTSKVGTLSIWEKLKRDNERKAALRAKLNDYQSDRKDGNIEKKAESKEADSPSMPPKYEIPFGNAETGGQDKPELKETDSPSIPPSTKASENVLRQDNVFLTPTRRSTISKSFSGQFLSPYQDDEEINDNLQIAFNFEKQAGLRRRDTPTIPPLPPLPESNGKKQKKKKIRTEKWYKVMSIVQETTKGDSNEVIKERMISSGRWTMPTLKATFRPLRRRCFNFISSLKSRMSSREVLDDFSRDSTYAVVTFTSRQAALAARHCLADSRGSDRWASMKDLPSPPLADAAVFNRGSCRGCCRPVTLSISDMQKKIRKYITVTALAIIYFFYTRPLQSMEDLVIPELESVREKNPLLVNISLGIIPALIWTTFFAVLPALFKFISNFGSNATSSVKAENYALKYFWWFMVVSAFTGNSFDSAVINGLFKGGIQIGNEVQKVIEDAAKKIPEEVSARWLNWMIVRAFIILPTQYLLQTNTFLFTWTGLKCCARAVRGGGAGGPVPYRIYVDSGVVMLCLFALAPASPLIAPAAMVYFFLSSPILRWTHIFLYKPKFDTGGQRFPFILDICISGMVVGQLLLTTMMVLKRAPGPAITAGVPLIPTIWYRLVLRRRHLRAYKDVALLQTSLLDGWDVTEESSEQTREDFRRFLVDCHKAAYVPVCIASGNSRTLITAEPAVVIPLESDQDNNDLKADVGFDESERSDKDDLAVSRSFESQPGRMLRRTSMSHRPNSSEELPAFGTPTRQPGVMYRRASSFRNLQQPKL